MQAGTIEQARHAQGLKLGDSPAQRRGVRDRRRAHRFVSRDRRTGFDRRRRYPVLDVMRDDEQLLPALALVNLLSLGDGVLTWIGLRSQVIAEGNPVLASLIAFDPYAAALFKVGVIALVTAGIWRWRKYRAILGVALFALVLYAGIIAYHAATIVMVALA